MMYLYNRKSLEEMILDMHPNEGLMLFPELNNRGDELPIKLRSDYRYSQRGLGLWNDYGELVGRFKGIIPKNGGTVVYMYWDSLMEEV